MLPEALRLIRVFHDMKQNELAEKFGISKSYLSEIESGKKTPTVDMIEKYSNEFNIPSSSILFFSESLENPASAARTVGQSSGIIARKVVQFLRLIEERTRDGSEKK